MRYDNQPELGDGAEILRERDARVFGAVSQLQATLAKMRERAGVAKPDQFTSAVQQLERSITGAGITAEQQLMANTAEIVNTEAAGLSAEAARLAAIRGDIDNIHASSQNNPLFGDNNYA